jgi:hypothetical protein
MPNVADIDPLTAYPPKWLIKDNVDALIGKFTHEISFKSVAYELVGEKRENKVVWRFNEISQGMVAKEAHHNACVAIHGAASSGWIGKRIRITKNPKYGTGNGETGLIVLPPQQAPAAVHQDAAEDVPF